MNYFLLLCCCWLALGSAAVMAQVPDAVYQQFHTTHHAAEDVIWRHWDGLQYEAVYIENGQARMTVYNPDGQQIESAEAVDVEELPASMTAWLEKQSTLDEADLTMYRVTRADGSIRWYYDMATENDLLRYVFDAQGHYQTEVYLSLEIDADLAEDLMSSDPAYGIDLPELFDAYDEPPVETPDP